MQMTSTDYRFGYPWVDVPGDDFLVFFDDFIRNAQRIITTQESLPHLVIVTPRRYGHDKAVCVKYNMLHGSFVRGTLVQMAETFYLSLIQGTVFPKSVYLFLRLLGKIIGNNLPQLGQHCRGLDERHHVQQFQLCLIEYGLHTCQFLRFNTQSYAFPLNIQHDSPKMKKTMRLASSCVSTGSPTVTQYQDF